MNESSDSFKVPTGEELDAELKRLLKGDTDAYSAFDLPDSYGIPPNDALLLRCLEGKLDREETAFLADMLCFISWRKRLTELIHTELHFPAIWRKRLAEVFQNKHLKGD